MNFAFSRFLCLIAQLQLNCTALKALDNENKALARLRSIIEGIGKGALFN